MLPPSFWTGKVSVHFAPGVTQNPILLKGVVYIKTSTMDHINHLVSTAGHELIHMADYVSGRYQLWYSFGANIAHAFTESRAYGWEISMGSPYGMQGNWSAYTSIANKFKSSFGE